MGQPRQPPAAAAEARTIVSRQAAVKREIERKFANDWPRLALSGKRCVWRQRLKLVAPMPTSERKEDPGGAHPGIEPPTVPLATWTTH
jgi:hypothetical protein